MTKVNQWKGACAIFLLCAATAIGAPGQTFTTLLTFDGTNGAYPAFVTLLQGADGNFYGTTRQGGTFNGCLPDCGTVFKITPRGTLITLHTFELADGSAPEAGLALATDGNFYGATSTGGGGSCGDCGTVFKITAGGRLTTLHIFNGDDGSVAFAALVQATNGNLYGTTTEGGAFPDCPAGCGTIFRITPAGEFTSLQAFEEPSGDPVGGLVQGTDGNLYGTASGTAGYGNIFKMTPGGTLTTTHYFNFTDGAFPDGKLVQGLDGGFYGTTRGGGANGNYGTVFKITRAGKLTTLHSFCIQTNCPDGTEPWAGLVLATDGNFYGTTYGGGNDLTDCQLLGPGCGTVFKIASDGNLTTLHSFSATDGKYPYGGLFQSTSGMLYGTTSSGGASDGGTVFSLDMGLGPFVTFVQAAGKVGQTGGILGQGFKGTTSVSLNGISASFKVVSETFIRATVPAGATTGYVTVTTPSGTLTSNVPFYVIP